MKDGCTLRSVVCGLQVATTRKKEGRRFAVSGWMMGALQKEAPGLVWFGLIHVDWFDVKSLLPPAAPRTVILLQHRLDMLS